MTTSGEEDKVPSSSIAIGAVVDEKDAERRRRRKESSRRREKEDKEAKRRARQSRKGVGSFHSTADDDPSKRKTARSSSRRDKEDAKAKERAKSPRSHRSSTKTSTKDASNRRAKDKNRSPSRSVAPGAVSVDASSSSSSSRKSKKDSSRKSKSGSVRQSTQSRVARERTKAVSVRPERKDSAIPVAKHKSSEPEVELIAEAVDDVENNANFKRLENENQELRREMQEILQTNNNQTNNSAENDDDDNDNSLEEKPRKSRCLWYLCGFVVVAAIAAGVVVFLLMRRIADEPPSTTEIDETPPSSSPSLAVTSAPTFSELTIQDCLAISEGRPVHNQESLSKRQFELKFEVSLVDGSEIGVIEKEALKEKMQQGPLLILAGCDPAAVASSFRGNRRMAVIDSNVGDAKVGVGNVAGPCAEVSSCFEIDIELLLFLEAYETDTSLIQLAEFVFGQDTFAMNAGTPFSSIELVSVEPLDPTTPSPNASPTQSPVSSPSASPSGFPTGTPSLNPTRAPGGGPTISPSVSPTELSSGAPSFTPSSKPSAAPTLSPSKSPTRVPVSDPTESPTASTGSPTKSPSISPSKSPTKTPTSNSPTSLPSAFPSLPPSSFPSVSPSIAPSTAPSESPSKAPSVSPSEAPSPAPSITPGRCGPAVGGTQCSCDSEFYHCSAWGYCGYGADEGPFYVEGEPREYDCQSGPVSLITSSAVATQSSTRTASNGQVMGAWRAIDGNTDSSDYFTCTQTFFDANAYWQVEIGFSAEVDKITIWNINEPNKDAWNRIKDSKLVLLDSDGVPLSTLDVTLGVTREPSSETFNFSPPLANVASVKITNTNGLPLQICEVQAYGYIQ